MASMRMPVTLLHFADLRQICSSDITSIAIYYLITGKRIPSNLGVILCGNGMRMVQLLPLNCSWLFHW